LTSRLVQTSRARLRTKARSPEDARRLLLYAARDAGVPVELQDGETWVLAVRSGDDGGLEVRETFHKLPPKRVHGFTVDDLDIGKLHLDEIEAKRRASLYRQMAELEEGWEAAAFEAAEQAKELRDLIEAWEGEHDGE
jgi:hypothetical protein